jgi:hypothetical protein
MFRADFSFPDFPGVKDWQKLQAPTSKLQRNLKL